MQSIITQLQSIGIRLLETLFPEYCARCDKKDTALCQECLLKVAPSPNCPETYMRARFSYADPITKELVRRLKFKHQHRVVETISRELSDLALSITEELLEAPEKIVLVPIPSNPIRTRVRGYDQATKLARAIEIHSGIPTRNVLRRTGTRPAQTTLSRKERLQNMHGAFTLKDSEYITGITIILIDDVITTGATMDEARNTLLGAGARAVYAVALAH